jgi:hypothetical protein
MCRLNRLMLNILSNWLGKELPMAGRGNDLFTDPPQIVDLNGATNRRIIAYAARRFFGS